MIGGDHWAENPRDVVPPDVFSAVDLWFECRAMKGRHLPCAGGVADQAAPLWAAFQVLPLLLEELEAS